MGNNVLDLLLASEIPQPRTRQLKIKRLSEHCGQDVVFTVKQLPYSRVAEIKRGNEDEMSLRILLAGVVEPDLKNDALKAKFDNAPTPAELVKRMLLPGEIEDISREIEQLCGYRALNIERLKKKSVATPTST